MDRIAPNPTSVGKLLELLSYQKTETIPAANPVTDEELNKIELTDEELAPLVREAKIDKYYQLRKEAVNEHKKAFVRELQRPWTAQEQLDYLFVRAKELELKFELTDQNRFVVEALCRYFTNDTGFVEMGKQVSETWSLNKGILLAGNVGTGKTTLMKLFGRNKRRCYDYVQCVDVANLFLNDGEMCIEHMSNNRTDVPGAQNMFQEKIGRYFDDLGTEDVVTHFGNKKNVMAEVLLKRYDARATLGMAGTHLSTNETPEGLKEKYGSRVCSRLNEMFNWVVLDGKDLRG